MKLYFYSSRSIFNQHLLHIHETERIVYVFGIQNVLTFNSLKKTKHSTNPNKKSIQQHLNYVQHIQTFTFTLHNLPFKALSFLPNF